MLIKVMNFKSEQWSRAGLFIPKNETIYEMDGYYDNIKKYGKILKNKLIVDRCNKERGMDKHSDGNIKRQSSKVKW